MSLIRVRITWEGREEPTHVWLSPEDGAWPWLNNLYIRGLAGITGVEVGA